jgi:hypothetical protein
MRESDSTVKVAVNAYQKEGELIQSNEISGFFSDLFREEVKLFLEHPQ